jgi:hypothetical protein
MVTPPGRGARRPRKVAAFPYLLAAERFGIAELAGCALILARMLVVQLDEDIP